MKEIVKYFVILNLCSLVQCYDEQIPSSIRIFALMNEFNIKNPTILYNHTSPKNHYQKIKFVKELSNLDHTIRHDNTMVDQMNYHPDIILTTNLDDLKLEFTNENIATLVVTQIQKEEDLNSVNIPIDKQIYFVDEVSWKTYESYTINEIQITKLLGQLQIANSTSNVEKVQFVESKHYISSFERRRSNFHGVRLNAMVEEQSRKIKFPHDFATNTNFFKNNQTYDMTNVIDGVYIDVLLTLEKTLNFSTKLYLRKDRIWGIPKKENGTVILDGMIKSLFENDFIDFIWAPLSIMPERTPYVKYLGRMTNEYGAIFIPKDDTTLNIHYSLYFEPLHLKLWITIMMTDFLIVAFSYIIEQLLISHPSLVLYYVNEYFPFELYILIFFADIDIIYWKILEFSVG